MSDITHTITFTAPCYLIYGDETGITIASGDFFVPGPPDEPIERIIPFTLNPHTFVAAEGELTRITITREGHPSITLTPTLSLEVGPNAWAILQKEIEAVWSLGIMQDGKYLEVPFVTEDPIPPPPPIIPRGPGPVVAPHPTPAVAIRNGAVYNGLANPDGAIVDALLSVTYYNFFGGGPNVTTPEGRGKETGGLLSAEIVSFNIRLTNTTTVHWFPDQDVQTAAEGMPIVIFGTVSEPGLAIFKEIGAAEIVKLVPGKRV